LKRYDLYAIVDAHNHGYDENMYLDAGTRTYVEETGGANFLFVTKDAPSVTPKSDSILPSITRRSLCVVAEQVLGMKVEHRKVRLTRLRILPNAAFAALLAVISPLQDC
jgi:branched-chain amino acid aminotransferase